MLSYHLPNALPNERTLLLLRRHPWILLRIVFVFLFLVAVPFAVYFLVNAMNPNFLDEGGSLRVALLTVGMSLYALMVWLFLFTAWVDYYLDVWIVTSERIVSMEQKGLFSRVTAELRLSRVQDVTSIQKGKMATFLNYGQVQVQTAAAQQEFVFEEIPNPTKVAQVILETHDAWVQAHPGEQQNVVTQSK
jgi:uncharacterized membrane protein YdbT with pleckstrin-like domain